MTASIAITEPCGTTHFTAFRDDDLPAIYTERERLDLIIGKPVRKGETLHRAAGIVIPFPGGRIVEARAELVRQSHAVIRSRDAHPDDVAQACFYLRAFGTGADHVLADQVQRAGRLRQAERVREAFNPRQGRIRAVLGWLLFAVPVLTIIPLL